jgi:hypothetical protein
VHTVELLLDDQLEAGVRKLWDLLLRAGLPSLATHTHPTNRPHLTVLTAASLTGLPALPPLPIPVELGPARILGRALVRAATPAPELHAFQAEAWSSTTDAWPPPADWAPHISLALKIPPARHDEALALLAAVPPAAGRFVAARSYDTDTRIVTDW